jgi:prepilin-type processing-associated H-X9-DG protein
MQNALPYACASGTNDRDRSWAVAIFPYIEQQSVYSNLTFGDAVKYHPGWNPSWGGGADATKTATAYKALDGLVVSNLSCPSSSEITKLRDETPTAPVIALGVNSPMKWQKINYVGISGTSKDPLNLTAAVPSSPDSYNDWYGHAGYNGVIIARHPDGASKTKTVDFAAIQDGTSNTVCVSEQSNLVWNQNKTKRYEWVASNQSGSGWHGDHSTKAGGCILNVTTIRYPINSICPGTDGGSAVGCNGPHQNNTIITSPHTGGANFTVCDGSVRFISETVGFDDILIRLASRNDGLPVAMP